jgi:hypothetical protein
MVGQKITVKVTPEGIMVSHPLIDAWGDAPELEIEQVADALVIKPKAKDVNQAEDRIVDEMKAAGLVEALPWAQPPVVPLEERARLAEKLGRGRPLSELVLAERDERA